MFPWRCRTLLNHKEELLDSFSGLLENGEFADVIFLVGENRIPAHRLILSCRSEYFKAMLMGSLREGSEKEVEINDADPEAFQRILRYFYTGTLSLEGMKTSEVMDLFRLAHLYQMKKMIDHLEIYFKNILGIENFFQLLDLACVYDLSDLLKSCLSFSDAHFKEVAEREEFLSASIAHVELILDGNVAAAELEIFKAALKWKERNINGDDETDQHVTKRLKKLIKLAVMDQKDILTTVTDSQFFEAQELLDALRIQLTKKPESPGFRIAQKKETFVFPTLVHLGQPIQPVLPVSLTTIRRQEHSRYRRDR